MRCAGRCGWCESWCRWREAHHVVARGMGAGRRLDVPINLIALGCSADWHSCHTFIHQAGKDVQRKVLEILAKRENTTPEDIEAVVWCLLRIPKERRQRDVEREIGGLTESQQVLAWRQLGYEAKGLPAVDVEVEF